MIGRTLSHYRITGQLGAGGMGVVYSAEDARLGRQVALKFVSSDLAHDEQALLRLRSEARAASALNHPNICTIYDIGEDDGHPFIVMELIKGQTLRDRLNHGPLKVLQLVEVGIEIADALHAAHREGIIHRDIKPGNIFLTERGHVKILDFGLAKLAHTLASATTADPAPHTSATGVTHGTPAYMSPEQATGEPLDGRTDLFSLGVVMYECATGHHPFPGKTSAIVLAGILDRAPVSPLTLNPELPARLTEIISNCLEKDRELRYQSAADLRADLKRLRRDLDSGAVRAVERLPGERSSARGEPPPSGRTPPAPIRDSGTESASSLLTTRSTRRRLAWTSAAVAVLVSLVVAGIMMWPPPTSPPADVATPAAEVPSPRVEPAPAPPAPDTPPTIATERQMALATARLNGGDYRGALGAAREVLALDPNHAAAVKIRDQAAAQLTRFENDIADARRRLTNGDLEGAARVLERARAIDSSSPSVTELSARLSEAFRTRENAARTAARSNAAEAKQAAAPPSAQSPPPSVVPQAVQPPASTNPVPPQPPPAVTTPVAPTPRAAEEPERPEPAPPPVAKPAPSTPPERETTPPAPAAENHDAAIRQVIATYGRAIEAKDIALFRSIKPNLTAEEQRRLQEGFRAVTSQRVSLTVMSIDRKGDRASAVVHRRDEIEAGGRKYSTDARQALSLSRGDSGWVIVDIR